MQTTYLLKPDDLNTNFLEAIKLLFGNKLIEISVKEVSAAATGANDLYALIETLRLQMQQFEEQSDDDPFANIRDRSSESCNTGYSVYQDQSVEN